MLPTVATAASSQTDPLVVLLFVAAALVAWVAARVTTARRNADRCARYGHVSDPKMLGTWSERCARCGRRL